MLIWINTNRKYKTARVIELIPKLVQLPTGFVCHVYCRYITLDKSDADNTQFIDNVNWHPVNQNTFLSKCYELKLPLFKFHGSFKGFRPK